MALAITEKAANELKKAIEAEDSVEHSMVRVKIVSGGCSGFNYSLTLDGDFDEANDNRSEQHGVTVLVDKKSALYLDETTVDYYDGIDARGFQFKNPMAKRTCGCGSSFQV